MKIEFFDDAGYFTPFYGVMRHTALMCKPGFWSVISMCPQLAWMQGVQNAHMTCVVDDFGDLVRVPS